ncbi:trypsin-like peptidase domain-containing protein, partial [Candidatus Roizmanbacteria bacterium]|nr:trypsin-like peptidase domain-containing protein [Candidatus Roizmanbacteria bacterium]
MKKLLLLTAALLVLFAIGQSLQLLPRVELEKYIKIPQRKEPLIEKQTVVYEESTVTKVVEEALPSVVTIGITKSQEEAFELDPFNPFAPFRRIPRRNNVERNIGSGFIVSSDGLIITNRHVVADTDAQYKVLTNDKKTYTVEKIYRDPLNDLAILKINASGLRPVKLGDSSKLKLGQLAIAIGTPLGQFTNTITVGIISGLGRGITA